MNAEHESKIHDAAQTLAAAASNYLPGVLYCIILVSPNAGPSGRKTGIVGNLHPDVLREMADQIEERAGDTVQPRAKSMAWSALAAAAVALLIVVLASYFECR